MAQHLPLPSSLHPTGSVPQRMRVIFSLHWAGWVVVPCASLCRLTLNMKLVTSVLISLPKPVFLHGKNVRNHSVLALSSWGYPVTLASCTHTCLKSHPWFSTELWGSRKNWLPRLLTQFRSVSLWQKHCLLSSGSVWGDWGQPQCSKNMKDRS